MAEAILQNNVLQLEGNLLIESISDLLKQISSLSLPTPLVLDFSKVKEIDTSAISLILELQRKIATQGQPKQVSIKGVSKSLRSLMQLYGVDTFLLN